MTSLRKADQPDHMFFYRSERVFSVAGLWYFKTREGQDIGPFRYESEARQMLAQFISDLQAAQVQNSMQPPKPHFRPRTAPMAGENHAPLPS